jgi:hypothetical protein
VYVPPVKPGGANAVGRRAGRSTSGGAAAVALAPADAATSAAMAAASLGSTRVWKQLQPARDTPNRKRKPSNEGCKTPGQGMHERSR